ncbi:MAG: TlpA family protein disulfide reductase [Gammaproteobacteria bacterium]|nr:MAG: TlpA family protein disulfide reductase [Gammaproteobacteria bacterium]
MKGNLKLLLLVALASALGMVAGFLVSQKVGEKQQSAGEQQIINESVDFTLPDTTDKQQSFSQWRGKLVLLNFWAPWCNPCRNETPLLIKAQNSYAGQGLQIIGLAVDEKQHVVQFMQDFGINYPVLLGVDEGIDLMEKLGNNMGALPFSAFIDPQGKVISSKLGEFTADELDNTLKKLLSASNPR